MSRTKNFASLFIFAVFFLGSMSAVTKPDFSGVYKMKFPPEGYVDANGKPSINLGNLDGSSGRLPHEPALTKEYLKKWQEISKKRIAGDTSTDYIAKCLPPGMPDMMLLYSIYKLEVMQTKDKITIWTGHNDAYRRIYLDGRKPLQRNFDAPSYEGYSTGQWEGDTLVVDTVAIAGLTYIDEISFSPHSDQMTVKERIRFIGPGLLEDHITVTDPLALSKPWEVKRIYNKQQFSQQQRDDETESAVCAEGLYEAK